MAPVCYHERLGAAVIDVVCLGELLFDLVSAEPDLDLGAARTFTMAPGGAPANVAVGCARLGLDTAFIGCVGQDAFGTALRETLEAERVDCRGLIQTAAARTTLAFIATRSDGAKDLLFYRHPGADTQLRPADLPLDLLRGCRALHVCSVSLSTEPVRSATVAALEAARAGGALISFDPNWRAPLWPVPAEGTARIRAALAFADVVKVADEELEMVAGTADRDAALDALLAAGPRLAIITGGRAGAWAATASGARASAPGYPVATVDTLGAGDAFVAGALQWLLGPGGGRLDLGAEQLQTLLRRANAAGALTTTRLGVIPALPNPGQIDVFLESQR